MTEYAAAITRCRKSREYRDRVRRKIEAAEKFWTWCVYLIMEPT